MTMRPHSRRFGQRGTAVLEIALVAIAFLTLLVGIVEFGRVLFTFNSAVEATRRGARLAVISAPWTSDESILYEMQNIMPGLEAGNVQVRYFPDAPQCDASNCEYVEIALTGYTMNLWFWPVQQITLPAFTTALPRESLGNS